MSPVRTRRHLTLAEADRPNTDSRVYRACGQVEFAIRSVSGRAAKGGAAAHPTAPLSAALESERGQSRPYGYWRSCTSKKKYTFVGISGPSSLAACSSRTFARLFAAAIMFQTARLFTRMLTVLCQPAWRSVMMWLCAGAKTLSGRPSRDRSSACGWLRHTVPLSDPTAARSSRPRRPRNV